MQSESLRECSGIVSSRVNPRILWAHNHSRDKARLFGMSQDGRHILEMTVRGASARDWEALATGPGPGGQGAYLYIADFGDNGASRQSAHIYRLIEPVVSASAKAFSKTVTAEKMTIVYPDGPKNAATLLVDPQTGQLAIVTKGSGSRVYLVSGFSAGVTKRAVKIAQIAKAAGGMDMAMGGDVSPDGKEIVINDHTKAGKLWHRPPGGSLWDAFKTPPCEVPMPGEPQGEAVAFAASGGGYFTLSEGGAAPIYFLSRTGT